MAKSPKKLYEVAKRLMDIIIALGFILILFPLYLITGLVIWLQDRHSPFYYQDRIGLNAVPFKFYKFRSMVINADDILLEDKELYKRMRSGANKMVDDPRVTKFGKFIRKYSIDEIPQMLNVLKGDMSVIGPRALRPDEYKMYADGSAENARKLKTLSSVKPGITGYWQVSGRSNVDFNKRIDMDCYYATKKSIWLDILILIKTPFAVIKGEGAY